MALCERCYGNGQIHVRLTDILETAGCSKQSMLGVMVCPECNGSGTQHCCDGLREQPAVGSFSTGE